MRHLQTSSTVSSADETGLVQPTDVTTTEQNFMKSVQWVSAWRLAHACYGRDARAVEVSVESGRIGRGRIDQVMSTFWNAES